MRNSATMQISPFGRKQRTLHRKVSRINLDEPYFDPKKNFYTKNK